MNALKIKCFYFVGNFGSHLPLEPHKQLIASKSLINSVQIGIQFGR